jgi:signal transduction histidine kinase
MLAHSDPLDRQNRPRASQPDSCLFLETLGELQRQIAACQSIASLYPVAIAVLKQKLLKPNASLSRVAIAEASRSPAGQLLDHWETKSWAGQAPTRQKSRTLQPSRLFHALSPTWLHALQQGEMIVGTTKNFSNTEREWLNQQGVQSILMLPLWVNDRLYGAIRFENGQEPRYWTTAEVDFFRSLAFAISFKLEALVAIAEVARVNQLQDEGVATVAHELRSPLANIQMLAQLLEANLEQEGLLRQESRVAHYVQMLQTECQRKNDMINDLLALARLGAPQESLPPVEVVLQVWIPYVAEAFQERLQNQCQHLQIEIPTDLPPWLTDLGSLERIMTELLHNACKYTPAAGTITITAVQQNDRLTIEITNIGVEIAAADLPHIFDKFYRIPTLDIWGQGGTGLGLPLVKRLVAHLGGTIEVRSAQKRVQFTLQFPLSQEVT